MHALVQHCNLEELAPIKARETAARQEDVEAKRLQKADLQAILNFPIWGSLFLVLILR